MSIKKQYLKTKPICKVTFKVKEEIGPVIKTIYLVGDFNKWNPEKTAMKKLKDDSFTVTLDLKIGQEYQFRYLANNEIWVNDHGADKYTLNPFGDADNCVVAV